MPVYNYGKKAELYTGKSEKQPMSQVVHSFDELFQSCTQLACVQLNSIFTHENGKAQYVFSRKTKVVHIVHSPYDYDYIHTYYSNDDCEFMQQNSNRNARARKRSSLLDDGATMTKPFIHPKTPSKLKSAYRNAKNTRGERYSLNTLARNIGVNWRYPWNLIKNGIEPNDSTPRLQEIRQKLGLAKKKRKTRAVKTKMPAPEYIQWWRRLSTDERNAWIRKAHNERLD